MRLSRKDQRGFTLTEVMVATGLFALVTPFIFSAFMSSSRQVQPATQGASAANIAKQIFELQYNQVREDRWGAWAVDAGPARTVNGKLYTPTANFGEVGAARPGAPDPDYRRVTVNVNWDAAL